MTRPSREQYALSIAKAAATRSEDPWVKVGASILRSDGSIASTGYNGAPSGIDMDWSDRDARRKWVIHAEMNALRYILPGGGVLLASTLMPCLECLKNTRAQGITKVVYDGSRELSSGYDVSAILDVAERFGMEMISL